MKFVKATVLIGRGTDKVYLQTEMPCSFTKAGLPEQTPLQLSFDATANTGADYVRKHFNMEPEIIKLT